MKGFNKRDIIFGNSIVTIFFKKEYDRKETCDIILKTTEDVTVLVYFHGNEQHIDNFTGRESHQLKANKEKTLTFSLASVKTDFSISVRIEGLNVSSKFSWRYDNTLFRFVPRDVEDIVCSKLQLQIPDTRPRGNSFELFDPTLQVDRVQSESESEFDPFSDEANALVAKYPKEFSKYWDFYPHPNDIRRNDDELERKNDALEKELNKLKQVKEAWNEANIQMEETNMEMKIPIPLKMYSTQEKYSQEKYSIINSLMNLSEEDLAIVNDSLNDSLQFTITMNVED